MNETDAAKPKSLDIVLGGYLSPDASNHFASLEGGIVIATKEGGYKNPQLALVDVYGPESDYRALAVIFERGTPAADDTILIQIENAKPDSGSYVLHTYSRVRGEDLRAFVERNIQSGLRFSSAWPAEGQDRVSVIMADRTDGNGNRSTTSYAPSDFGLPSFRALKRYVINHLKEMTFFTPPLH